jgi:serine/threonine protein kinase
MAPEVLLGEGYSFIIDYWSIGNYIYFLICIYKGISMYEFYCGSVPFGETADDPMQVYISIINQ